MNCTDKEWQHCRVEKMGCDGCFYNECISKEKIKNKINELHKKIEQLQIQYALETHYAYKTVNLGEQKILIEQAKLLKDLLYDE